MPDTTREMHRMNTYYDRNAERFFRETVALDMRSLHAPFRALMPDGALILDAGCGSGRDSRAFLDAGYRVHAFDASPRLAALAGHHLGQPVDTLRFDQVNWSNRFDGVWACASLLHVPWAKLPDALERLATALKPEGALYASFKYGDGEREEAGRHFTDLDEAHLAELLERVPSLALERWWITNDRRPDREDERWLNMLARKPEESNQTTS